MSEQPLVSIVIPVYNGSNYLAEAIDSALAQTYPNIEVLVVNDGSTDDGATREIAMRYEDQIRYFEKENGGVATALNYGIREMRGEYFSWLSHDDKYYSNKIYSQIDYLNATTKEDTDIVLYTDVEYIDKSSNHISYLRFPHTSPENFRPALALRSIINGCTLLIPKICFEECGIFNAALKTTQDYDLWFRFSEKFKFVHIPEILVFTRLHADQDSIKHNKVFYRERVNLIQHFLNCLSLEEIRRYSENDAAGYFFSMAYINGMELCFDISWIAIVKAFKNISFISFLKKLPKIISLLVFLIYKRMYKFLLIIYSRIKKLN